jgi:hypothetical protein
MKRLLLLAALLLSAYASAGAPASASASPYVGTWSAHLSSAQMINQGLDPRLAGRFRLVLRRNDTYTSFNSLDGASQGRFTVSGRRIVFFDDAACKAGGLDKKAAYTWSIARGRLRLTTFTVGGDACGGRWQTLTYPLWKRS